MNIMSQYTAVHPLLARDRDHLCGYGDPARGYWKPWVEKAKARREKEEQKGKSRRRKPAPKGKR